MLVVLKGVRYGFAVSTLSEIEAAADALTPEQKQELLLFLAARLRAQGAKLPEPRKFSREQIANWIGRDEADMRRFRQGQCGCFWTPVFCLPSAVRRQALPAKSSVGLLPTAGSGLQRLTDWRRCCGFFRT